MKILQVVPFYPPAWAWGGPVITAYGISKELARRGHDITVYTTDSLDPVSRVDVPKNSPLDLDGVRVYYFKNVSHWLAGKQHIQCTPALIKVARRSTPGFDILHLHGYRPFQNIIACHYAKKYGIPYVLHAQGTLPRAIPKSALKVIFDRLWGRDILKHARKLIAMTSLEAEQYRTMGVSGGNIEVIPTGIELDEFAALPSRGGFRQRHGIAAEDKLILYLGRIHRTKGIDMLVKAFARVREKSNKVKLVVAGADDGYLPALKILIRERRIDPASVIFTGFLSQCEKVQAYVDADVFVLPSPTEPYGAVLLEACACGTPVILSNGGGLADTLDGRGGLAVPCDENELLQALLRILGDDILSREMGQRGRRLVFEQFNLPVMVDRLERLYQSCLG